MSKREELYANDAVWAAFYRDGKDLGEICKQFECGIYELSPWLTAPLTGAITEALFPKEGSDIGAIMEQAQVFASTYSLVGGVFDDGSKMQQSEEEKAELLRMVSAAVKVPA